MLVLLLSFSIRNYQKVALTPASWIVNFEPRLETRYYLGSHQLSRLASRFVLRILNLVGYLGHIYLSFSDPGAAQCISTCKLNPDQQTSLSGKSKNGTQSWDQSICIDSFRTPYRARTMFACRSPLHSDGFDTCGVASRARTSHGYLWSVDSVKEKGKIAESHSPEGYWNDLLSPS